MAVKNDPMLAIWGAINLLAEIQLCCDTIEISEMLAETEEVLFNALLEFARNPIKYQLPDLAADGVVVH